VSTFRKKKKTVEKIKFNQNLTRLTYTVPEDQYIFMIISRSVLLRISNVSDKICGENQNTRFVFSNFFFSDNRVVYVIIWKSIVERGRPQTTTWRMRFASWISKAINTHTGCVLFIGLPLQQWLRERASTLRYTYISSFAFIILFWCEVTASMGVALDTYCRSECHRYLTFSA
jgi:hypothetical protein